ncbi:MAG: SpoIIE family protein phosphatase [Oscillospiraceae bacterium]
MSKQIHFKPIRKKLTRMVIAVTLLSLTLLGTIAQLSIVRMRDQSMDISTHLGEQAAADSRQLLENEAMDQLRTFAAAKAENVDSKLQTVMSQVDLLASAAEELYATPDAFGSIPVYPTDATRQGEFTAQIVYSERVTAEKVANEVGLLGNLTTTMKAASQHLAGVGTTQIGTESGFIIMCDENSGLKTSLTHLEPTERSWYRMAADSGVLTWSEVFEDSFGRGLAVTCGKPVYGPDGQLKAVVSIGSTLDDMSSTITSAAIGKTGYAFVVDKKGDIIMSKNLQLDAQGHVTDKENLLEDPEPSVREAAQKMILGERGVAQVKSAAGPVYMAYEPMKAVPWTVVTVMQVNEVMMPAAEGEHKISTLTQQAGTDIDASIRTAFILFGVALVASIALAVGLGTTFSRRITKPLMVLNEGVKVVSGGKLDYFIDLHTGDETETLANSFNKMTRDLLEQMINLKHVTAEKERIGAELDVANHIQASMLPSIFPAFPERPELDIYATMTPAKEVGGDFYDFFLLDDDRLALVMADVSGKGVPAALFMVIAKTLLKNVAQTGLSPKQVLEKVNNQLCVGNDAEMFVTVWLGVMEISTGKLVAANAGHEFPVIKRADGDYQLIRDKHGFVLSGMEGSRYTEYELQLDPGDKLFLYTDGVPEATDANNELFGNDRMLESLNRHKDENCESLLHNVKLDVENFVGSAPQFDDITMLSLERKDVTCSMKKLRLTPSLDSIEQVTAFLDQTLEAAEVPMKIIAQMDIAADEIFSNIARYSGASDATIGISIEDGIIELRFADNGLPYDPTKKADPDISLTAEERSIGGLGLYMVKKSMDEMLYEYHDGLNILHLTKKV